MWWVDFSMALSGKTHNLNINFTKIYCCLCSLSAPDQPVYNLLQLLSESGAPCQEDLPAWLFVFLHSCQDETGQLKVLPHKILALRTKCTASDLCKSEQLLVFRCALCIQACASKLFYYCSNQFLEWCCHFIFPMRNCTCCPVTHVPFYLSTTVTGCLDDMKCFYISQDANYIRLINYWPNIGKSIYK